MAGARCQGAAITQALTQQQSGAPQQRRFISVDVPNGNVDKAWRTLSRKLREEGYIDKAQSKKFFVKPSEQRKVEAASSRRRYRKQQFSELLRWVMQRKTRGF
ncbi:hypothetical protein D9Q98_000705 [Chlorella vulgaris]|uniref:30S ribosomal protein S21 n=1 Tax=Chlorella vulgaris TaxID=3077 RepID=A0A9D4TYX7_CHLVU|nr:hypothetical protein D9Q98_000705 [Chlorella vulgaris]